MIKYELFNDFGSFAEDKVGAKELRINSIMPNLDGGYEIELDFLNVENATQSFIHVLISDIIRKYGIEIMDNVSFSHCNENIKTLISIVFTYMQDSIDNDESDNFD